MSTPDRGVLVKSGEPIQGSVQADGPVIVVTAMRLDAAAREALAQRLGPGHIVRDIREADSADVVLVPPVSGQLVGRLRGMFPGAKILVAELSDPDLDLDLPGPVSRMMDTGVDGYFVAPDLGHLAAATREVVQNPSRSALGSGGGPVSFPALEAGRRRGSLAVLHLVGSPAALSGQRVDTSVVIDVDAWMRELGLDADTAARLRCSELAWSLAHQVLERGLDVDVAGVDHADWERRARGAGFDVVDER